MAGRPRARIQIVPPQDVLDNQVIHTEKWTLYGLGNAMTNSDNIFKWLTAHRLIKTYFPNSDGGTSTGMMTSSMHLCVASLTDMLYNLI
jgi:hypothetical protein